MNRRGITREIMSRLRRRRPASDFFEDAPAWDMPDLRLEELEIEPRQLAAGSPAVFSVSAVNVGVGTSGHAEVRFHVEGEVVGVVPVRPLDPGERVEARVEWLAETPGPHRVWAELELRAGWVNEDTRDRRVDSRLWVETDGPQPADVELALVAARFDDDSRSRFTVQATNIGLGTLAPTDLHAYLDGERTGRTPPSGHGPS